MIISLLRASSEGQINVSKDIAQFGNIFLKQWCTWAKSDSKSSISETWGSLRRSAPPRSLISSAVIKLQVIAIITLNNMFIQVSAIFVDNFARNLIKLSLI